MSGKRLVNAYKNVDKNKSYSLKEAIALVKANAVAKFDETIDLAINLGVDPKYADQMVRGVCGLPHGNGKTVRVAVLAQGEKADEAKAAGADIVGAENLVDSILAGKIDFDRCIATPDMMGLAGRVARVLGPKGLMPNPKLGTVTADVANAVKKAKAGEVQFRVEKNGIVHAGIAKASFSEDKIYDNAKMFIETILKAKPQTLKGTYLKKISLSDRDTVIGLAASGRTPYVIGALEYANSIGCHTAAISCNSDSEIGRVASLAIEILVGPEVLTGSTRLKAGTAQKLVLNMISTATMVSIGKCYENLMVDVMQSNEKLHVRAQNIVMEATGVTRAKASDILEKAGGSAKKAIVMILDSCSALEAENRLAAANGHIRAVLC